MSRLLVVFNDIGVIEQSYTGYWNTIARICGVKQKYLFSLERRVYENTGLYMIKDRESFISKLDEVLQDVDMTVPQDDRGYADVTGVEFPVEKHRKAEYLYHVYQMVLDTVPYRKDVADLFNSLPQKGIDIALLSNAGIWDLKRQNKHIDTSVCSFVWRSCEEGIPVSRVVQKPRADCLSVFPVFQAPLEEKAIKDVEQSGKYDRVLLIDYAWPNLKVAERHGWKTHLDVHHKDDSAAHMESAESLAAVIREFAAEEGVLGYGERP